MRHAKPPVHLEASGTDRIATPQSRSSSRRVLRPVLTRAKIYRVAVPGLIAILVTATIVLLILAGGILLGLVPYSGR